MATNRELKVEIEALSAELGVSVETERLNNASLGKKVEELREQVAALAAGSMVVSIDAVDDAFTDDTAAAQAAVAAASGAPFAPAPFGATKRAPREEPAQALTAAAEAPPVRQEPEPTKAVQEPAPVTVPATLGGRYTVAQGCVVHGLRGRIGAFQPIKARDLSGGQDALAELVRSGHVVRKP
jgi:hypothetical protein